MRRLLRLTLVASVLYGTGAHWAALQGAAWAGMLAARVQRTSWAEAVASTFSGTKPCRMCRVVERGSAADPRPVPPLRARGADFAAATSPVLVVRIIAETLEAPSPESPQSRGTAPAVPPPITSALA